MYIRHGGAPLPETYSSISEAFRQRMLMKPKHRRLRWVGSQSSLSLVIWEVGWPSSETTAAAILDAQFRDHIHDPMQWSGSWQFP